MQIQRAVSQLQPVLGRENILTDVPMSQHTSFKTGGNADLLLFPQNNQHIIDAIRILCDLSIPYYMIGNGSNLLVLDGGIRGAVIKLDRGFDRLSSNKNEVRAQAGARLSALVRYALSVGLTGLEFACGIPGTVGGGIYMNAGAYGNELKDFVKQVTILDENMEIQVLGRAQMEFGYRTSLLQKKPGVILDAVFHLDFGDVAVAKEQIKVLNARRREKQPLELPSAGSTFKRPPGYFAGTLIEQAGLKGLTVGGAQVSLKHAGFIVNLGNATSADILELIEKVQKRVEEFSGVHLLPEDRILGERA